MKLTKKWWFWLIAVILLIALFPNGNQDISSENRETNISITEEVTTSQTSVETTHNTDPPKTEQEFLDTEGTLPKPNEPKDILEVHFIDVGQGDCIFIKSDNANILIDAGERGDTVVNYLKNENISRLDLIVSTHPHADHIGGLINVLKSVKASEVLDPAVVHTSKTFEDYLTLIDEKNIKFTEARAGLKIQYGELHLEVLHPVSPSSNKLNDASIVIRLTYGDTSFMFTGDAESISESEILNRDFNLDSTVLKVGHHGSVTSSSDAFLKSVSPEVAVIMCGADNTYGHPHKETKQKLSGAGIDVYRTDLNGTIIITTDGTEYEIATEK